MIIWGSKVREKVVATGEFYCPECTCRRSYHNKESSKYFTLYFVPLFETKKLGNYIECTICKSTYKKEVLEHDPDVQLNKIEALFRVAIKRVMLRMVLVDGKIDESEISTIAEIYSNLTNTVVTEKEITDELKDVQFKERNTDGYTFVSAPISLIFADIQHSLNAHGKELIMQAIIDVATADEVFSEEEQNLVFEVAEVLGLSTAHLKGILREAGITN